MIYSLLFYNSVLGVSCLFVWFYSRAVGKLYKKISIFFAFLVVSLAVGFRYRLGIDYDSYERIFNAVQYGAISWIEPGYYYLNYAVSVFGGGSEALFLIVASITYLILFLSLPKRNSLAFYYFLFMVVFFQSFNIMRNVMALAIIMPALWLLTSERKGIIRYYLLAFLGMSIHASVAVFLIFPFFKWISRFRYYLPYIIVFVCVVFGTLGMGAIRIVFDNPLAQMLGYTSYFDSDYFDEPAGTGLVVFLRCLFLIYVALFFRRIVATDRKNIYFMMLIVLCCVCAVLSMKVIIFKRLEDIFSFAYVFAPIILLRTPGIPFRKLVVLLFGIYQFMVFNLTIVQGSVESCRGAAVAPYVTVFDKENSKRIDRVLHCK